MSDATSELESQVNDRRLRYLLQTTKTVRLPKDKSALVLDDTLCEHVGSLFEYIDRHYHHGDDTVPLAHNPVTSHFVSGPVRFPVDLRLYRRYEEVTEWETFVHKHFPDREIPKRKQERAQFHKSVDPVLQQDPAFQALANAYSLVSGTSASIDFKVLVTDTYSVVALESYDGGTYSRWGINLNNGKLLAQYVVNAGAYNWVYPIGHKLSI